MTILTGETGAGKSILFDAVSIGLGARFDSRFIRHGASTGEITLCFDVTHATDVKTCLNDQQLDIGSECIVRRVFTKNGRSKCSINDTPCTVQLIRQLGECLLAFYGQHEHQALLKNQTQRTCLDRFANHMNLCATIKLAYERHTRLTLSLAELELKNKTADTERDYLQYQLQELESLELKPNDWEVLSRQHKKYLRLKNNRENLAQIRQLLVEGEQTISGSLNQVISSVEHIDEPSLNNVKKLLSTAEIHLQEAAMELQQYDGDVDLSEEAFQQLDIKLSKIYNLARKHKVQPDKLWKVVQHLEQEMEKLNDLEKKITELHKQKNTLFKKYRMLAPALTEQRKKAALKLSVRVTEQLQHLGMKGAKFEVCLVKRDEPINPHGQEKIVFMMRTNPGQPLMVMQKIISGGELSRLGLALQVIARDVDGMKTLVFDEIDTGIGGKTAHTVGKLLRQLGINAQVFCITHLPQVASKANHHFNVVKRVQSGETFASIYLLNRQERIKELARMSTGGKMTDTLLKHAEALLAETE